MDNGFVTSKPEPVCAYPANDDVLILMKAANQLKPPPRDPIFCGLDMKGGILVIAIFHAPVGPDAFVEVIACGCVAQGKACSTQYSFYHYHVICMMVCICGYGDMCRNPLKQKRGRRKVKLKTNHYNDHNIRP